MKNKLLQYIHDFTLRCMKFLMDNEYPITYDSDIVCQEGTIFDECYCPLHINYETLRAITDEGDN